MISIHKNDIQLLKLLELNMERVVEVITTKDDALGGVYESNSDEFKKAFNEASVIISKNGGNLVELINILQN